MNPPKRGNGISSTLLLAPSKIRPPLLVSFPNLKGTIMTTTKTIVTAALILGAFMGGANALSLKANTRPQAPGSIAAPAQPGATEDYYCKNGHGKFADCSPAPSSPPARRSAAPCRANRAGAARPASRRPDLDCIGRDPNASGAQRPENPASGGVFRACRMPAQAWLKDIPD